MINFILFNIILLVAGFVAVLILSVGVMACVAPIALFAKSGSPPRVVMLPLTGIGAIYQLYVWGGWSAFCVAMTIRFTQKPEVTWDWLYWIAGFMECVSPIAWLAHKEQQGSRSLAEVRGIQKGTMLYSLFAIAAFLAFAFAPSLIQRPYGWALTPLGFAYGGSTSPVEQGAGSPASGEPRSFKCEQPLPEFTLGRASNPSDAELAKLCACIWSKLPEGGWEREVSAKIRRAEDPGWRGRGFIPRFGAALDACGGRSL